MVTIYIFEISKCSDILKRIIKWHLTSTRNLSRLSSSWTKTKGSMNVLTGILTKFFFFYRKKYSIHSAMCKIKSFLFQSFMVTLVGTQATVQQIKPGQLLQRALLCPLEVNKQTSPSTVEKIQVHADKTCDLLKSRYSKVLKMIIQ